MPGAPPAPAPPIAPDAPMPPLGPAQPAASGAPLTPPMDSVRCGLASSMGRSVSIPPSCSCSCSWSWSWPMPRALFARSTRFLSSRVIAVASCVVHRSVAGVGPRACRPDVVQGIRTPQDVVGSRPWSSGRRSGTGDGDEHRAHREAGLDLPGRLAADAQGRAGPAATSRRGRADGRRWEPDRGLRLRLERKWARLGGPPRQRGSPGSWSRLPRIERPLHAPAGGGAERSDRSGEPG